MGEASKIYPFEDFVEWVFRYRPNSVDVDSLKKNKPTCEKNKYLWCAINEEVINTFVDIIWNMWKKFYSKGYEKSLDTPLKEEVDIHEVEHQSPRCGCREEHEEEGEDKPQSLLMGVVQIKENILMDPWTMKGYLLMGSHDSMLVT